MLLHEQNFVKIENPLLETPRFLVKIIETQAEMDAARKLAFSVFNDEIGSAITTVVEKGVDPHDFNQQYMHLIVMDKKNDNRVVGNYRFQEYNLAKQGDGFFIGYRYDLSDLPQEISSSFLELGRACIAKEFRKSQVLLLLWKSLGLIAAETNSKFYLGTSTFMNCNNQDAHGINHQLRSLKVYHPTIRLPALEKYKCHFDESLPIDEANIKQNDMLNLYLKFTGKVCSEPCYIEAINTLDYLTLIKVEEFPKRMVQFLLQKYRVGPHNVRIEEKLRNIFFPPLTT